MNACIVLLMSSDNKTFLRFYPCEQMLQSGSYKTGFTVDDDTVVLFLFLQGWTLVAAGLIMYIFIGICENTDITDVN